MNHEQNKYDKAKIKKADTPLRPQVAALSQHLKSRVVLGCDGGGVVFDVGCWLLVAVAGGVGCWLLVVGC